MNTVGADTDGSRRLMSVVSASISVRKSSHAKGMHKKSAYRIFASGEALMILRVALNESSPTSTSRSSG